MEGSWQVGVQRGAGGGGGEGGSRREEMAGRRGKAVRYREALARGRK